jgi:mannose/cellobiose epimerase-like protein (N-acyl-D-glucosamine 2-epimerase family)
VRQLSLREPRPVSARHRLENRPDCAAAIPLLKQTETIVRVFDPADFSTLRPWLLDHVCPFWLKRVLDPAGGFIEEIDALGSPVARPRRTTLVQARLTYVFSHAYVLNGDPSFGDAARHGMAFLMRAARAPDGGWFRAVSSEGATLDNTRDAYDHAFVLFALAWYFRATHDASAIQLADATWQSMQARLADPGLGGFFEEFVPGRSEMKLPRRQNPHMHLLEALLAMHVATGEKNWLRRAGAIVHLFKNRFVDPATGAIAEFFAADWSPAPGDAGRAREPGHQFEWVWLLHEYCRLTRDDSVTPYAERLFAFGEKFGIERDAAVHGAIFDCLDADGSLTAGTKLLWPQTEYLKALVARTEWFGDEAARPAMSGHLKLIADHFLRPDGASWHNQLARDGRPLTSVTPARVLYHLFMAVAEVDRFVST